MSLFKCQGCGREYGLHSLHCVLSYRGANSGCISHDFSHLYCDSCVYIEGMKRLQTKYNPDKVQQTHGADIWAP